MSWWKHSVYCLQEESTWASYWQCLDVFLTDGLSKCLVNYFFMSLQHSTSIHKRIIVGNKQITIDWFIPGQLKTENTINLLAEEIRELNKIFKRVESDIAMVINVKRYPNRCCQLTKNYGEIPNTREEIVFRPLEYFP